jgi:large subunit ribosomal protein L21
MFAVIRTGGKQYKVSPGDVIRVEKIPVKKGEIVCFEDVLLASDKQSNCLEKSNLKNVKIESKVIDHIRDNKIIVFKKRRRQSSQNKNGHRQNLTIVRITSIKNTDVKI